MEIPSNAERSKNQEIEGLGDDVDASLGDYPIDTVLIRNENRTVHDVLRRIEKGGYVMDPEFQREFIWPEDKQSKLIESVLMRIPLPVFYLAENSKGQMIVVDGLQRLSTFLRFVNDELKLKLPKQPDLNGKYFTDLSPKLQNRIEDCNLVLYLIDARVPPQALLDIFDRVNSGMPLTRQQMRNCLFMGESTKLLKRNSESPIFLKATGNSLDRNKMRDREFINRFYAFKALGTSQYKGDMDDFLALALEEINSMNGHEIEDLEASFERGMKNNIICYGKHAFRKHSKYQQGRNIINASLWDVQSVVLSEYSTEEIEEKKDIIKQKTLELFEDPAFHDAITLGTSQTNRVYGRFYIFSQAVKGCLHDQQN